MLGLCLYDFWREDANTNNLKPELCQETAEDSDTDLCAGYEAAPTLHIGQSQPETGQSQPETKGVLVSTLHSSDIVLYNAFFFPENEDESGLSEEEEAADCLQD